MKTYQVKGYDDRDLYTVSIDDNGVVDVDGLMPQGTELLKYDVERHIGRGLTATVALQKAIGAYSHLEEIDTSVTDPL